MSHPNAVDGKSENGFSLVEVLTALVIAAFALVVLMRGLGTSQTTAVYLESHLGARLLARSILEDERQSGETKPGRRSGDSGQYHWTLDVSPTELAGVEKSTTNTRLYRLTAEIRWAPRGRLVLDTLKFSK